MQTFTSIAATVALWLMACGAQAQVSYRLTPINDFSISDPVEVTLPRDLNNAGTVVGSGSRSHAVRWRNGRTTDLHSLIDDTAFESEADACNDRFETVGFFSPDGTNFRSYLLRLNQVTEIHVLPEETNVFAVDINNRSQAIGLVIGADGHGHQFVWHRGRSTLLPSLTGTEGTINAEQINDHGTIVGTDSTNGQRVVIWRNGAIVEVGGLPQALASRGTSINDRSVVLGNSELPSDSSFRKFRAFTWARGQISELPPLPSSTSSEGARINDAGVVVGSSFTEGPRTATLWRDGVALNLNDLVAAEDPLKPFVTLTEGRLINDRGEIVVFGSDSRAPFFTGSYLLTPAAP